MEWQQGSKEGGAETLQPFPKTQPKHQLVLVIEGVYFMAMLFVCVHRFEICAQCACFIALVFSVYEFSKVSEGVILCEKTCSFTHIEFRKQIYLKSCINRKRLRSDISDCMADHHAPTGFQIMIERSLIRYTFQAASTRAICDLYEIREDT